MGAVVRRPSFVVGAKLPAARSLPRAATTSSTSATNMRTRLPSSDQAVSDPSSDGAQIAFSQPSRPQTPYRYESSSENEHPPLQALRSRPTSARKQEDGAVRPRYTALDYSITREINRFNGVIGDDDDVEDDEICQFLGPKDDTEVAHIVAHSDYHTWRPGLWLKLVGLLSFDTKTAAREKAGVFNTIRVSSCIHKAFCDKDWAQDPYKPPSSPAKIRMVLVPTVEDLVSTILVVETALAREEQHKHENGWAPDTSAWLNEWPKSLAGVKTWDYHLIVLAQQDHYNKRQPLFVISDGQAKHPLAVDQRRPLTLHPPIPSRRLPLNIVHVVLAAMSAMWSPDSGASYTSDFKVLLKLMDYLLTLYESTSPSSWRYRRPDPLLPFNAPASPVRMNDSLGHPTRQFATPQDHVSPYFSESPPSDMRCLPRSRTAAHGNGIAFPALAAKADDLVHLLVDRMAVAPADISGAIPASPLTKFRQQGAGAFGVGLEDLAEEVRAAEEEEEQREQQRREGQAEPWRRADEDLSYLFADLMDI